MQHGDGGPKPYGRLLGQALAIAGKDLRVEWVSRVTTVRVVPFAGVLVLLFAVALDPDRGLLPRVAPGLFWLAVLLSALLAVGRAFAVERENSAGAGLLLSGLDPAAMYLGKAAALVVQLLALEAVVGVTMTALYDVTPEHLGLIAAASVLATAGIAAAGTLYGALVAVDRGATASWRCCCFPCSCRSCSPPPAPSKRQPREEPEGTSPGSGSSPCSPRSTAGWAF